MQSSCPVVVDLANGMVMLGGTRVALGKDQGYAVTPDGVRLRPITFQERSRAVKAALTDADSGQALLKELRILATDRADGLNELADALVLALAGGGEPAPAFTECARAACRIASLDWKSMQETAALLVDRLALSAASTNDDGWTHFEFQPPATAPQAIEDCCRQMLERLLARGTPRAEDIDVENCPAAPPFGAEPEEAGISQVPLLAWPQNGQPLRARAKFLGPEQPGQSGPGPELSAAPGKPSFPAAGVLQKTSRDYPQNGQAQAGPPQAGAQVAEKNQVLFSAVNDPGWSPAKHHAPSWQSASTPLRISPAIETPAGSRGAAATQTVMPAAQVRPAGTRPRTRRLHEVTTTPQKAAQPGPDAFTGLPVPSAPVSVAGPAWSDARSSDAKFKDAEFKPAIAQRDWLYEIATALAEECDLRGLDS